MMQGDIMGCRMLTTSLASAHSSQVRSSKFQQQKCFRALSGVLGGGRQKCPQLSDYCFEKFPTIICLVSFVLSLHTSGTWGWEGRITGQHYHLFCTCVYFSHFVQWIFITSKIRVKNKGLGHTSFSEKHLHISTIYRGFSPLNDSWPGLSWGTIMEANTWESFTNQW